MKKSSKKQEVTPEIPAELKFAINKAAQEYMKNSFQQKVEGWDKWWAYCRPSHRHIGSLSKITFEVGKKEVTEAELLEKIKANITKRLIEGESHFTSGFRLSLIHI